MKIHIEKTIYLENDGTQFMIKQYGKPNAKGEETYKTLGYFGQLNSAIKYLIKMKIHESNATTLKELLADIKQIEAWVDERVGG